jgi:hypothetical protein
MQIVDRLRRPYLADDTTLRSSYHIALHLFRIHVTLYISHRVAPLRTPHRPSTSLLRRPIPSHLPDPQIPPSYEVTPRASRRRLTRHNIIFSLHVAAFSFPALCGRDLLYREASQARLYCGNISKSLMTTACKVPYAVAEKLTNDAEMQSLTRKPSVLCRCVRLVDLDPFTQVRF